MKHEAGGVVVALMLALVTSACGQRVSPLAQVETPLIGHDVPTNATASTDACDRLAVMTSTCPTLDLECPSEAAAQCMLGSASRFSGYCAVATGDDICDGTTISPNYESYCAFLTCMGGDTAQCLADGRASCTIPNSPCQDMAELAATCPGGAVACPSDQAAAGVRAAADSFAGFCAISAGGSNCDAGAITQSYRDYCTIQACLGADLAECLSQGTAGCSPPAPTVCDQIATLAGSCPGYGYDCAAYPSDQSECFLSVLQFAVEQNGSACFIFQDSLPLCVAGEPSVQGFYSCSTQECFALTTYDACMGNLEVLCPWTSP
jgi:hypothetical protein